MTFKIGDLIWYYQAFGNGYLKLAGVFLRPVGKSKAAIQWWSHPKTLTQKHGTVLLRSIELRTEKRQGESDCQKN